MISFLTGAIAMGVVFLYGCLGETITEKVGNLNLGIPGIMAMGALGGCLGVNIYFGIFGDESIISIMLIFIILIFACLFAAIGGLIYAFLTVTLQANQNVTGLVLTTFGVGIMKFIGGTVNMDKFSMASKSIKTLFTNYDKLGWFGELFLSYGFFVYLGFALAIATSIILKKTRVGLFLRSVGESPQTADAQGVSIVKYKYIAILIGAAIAGIGGVYYVMDRSGGTTFTEANIEGFGWMAVALVIFSIWKPGIGAIGSIVFGALYILQSYVHVSNIQLKAFAMLPYVATIVILVLTSAFGGKKIQAPASLGVNYFREDR